MSEPVSIGGAADRFMGLSGDRRALRASSVLAAWHQVAGDEVSRHTEGGRFRDGHLLVYVDSPAWANELQVMGEAFRGSLNARLGKETVTSLRFSVSRRVGAERERRRAEREAESRYEPRKALPRELTAEERRRVVATAGEVGDNEVRKALGRAMEADLLHRDEPSSKETRRVPGEPS